MKAYERDGIKYDSDKSNDYSDGYDAAKRHYTKKIKEARYSWIVAGVIFGMILEGAVYLIGHGGF